MNMDAYDLGLSGIFPHRASQFMTPFRHRICGEKNFTASRSSKFHSHRGASAVHRARVHVCPLSYSFYPRQVSIHSIRIVIALRASNGFRLGTYTQHARGQSRRFIVCLRKHPNYFGGSRPQPTGRLHLRINHNRNHAPALLWSNTVTCFYNTREIHRTRSKMIFSKVVAGIKP